MLPLFRVSAIVVAALLTVLMLYAGEPSQLWWWVGIIPFAVWAIGAAVAPYFLATYADRFSLLPFVFGVFTLSNVLAWATYVQAFLLSTSSTSALVMIFTPLYQWLVNVIITVVLIVAAVIRRAKRPRNA